MDDTADRAEDGVEPVERDIVPGPETRLRKPVGRLGRRVGEHPGRYPFEAGQPVDAAEEHVVPDDRVEHERCQASPLLRIRIEMNGERVLVERSCDDAGGGADVLERDRSDSRRAHGSAGGRRRSSAIPNARRNTKKARKPIVVIPSINARERGETCRASRRRRPRRGPTHPIQRGTTRGREDRDREDRRRHAPCQGRRRSSSSADRTVPRVSNSVVERGLCGAVRSWRKSGANCYCEARSGSRARSSRASGPTAPATVRRPSAALPRRSAS